MLATGFDLVESTPLRRMVGGDQSLSTIESAFSWGDFE
jgi:hypothetical protein